MFVTPLSLVVASGIVACFLAVSDEFWFFKPSLGLKVAVGLGFSVVEALTAALCYVAWGVNLASGSVLLPWDTWDPSLPRRKQNITYIG